MYFAAMASREACLGSRLPSTCRAGAASTAAAWSVLRTACSAAPIHTTPTWKQDFPTKKLRNYTSIILRRELEVHRIISHDFLLDSPPRGPTPTGGDAMRLRGLPLEPGRPIAWCLPDRKDSTSKEARVAVSGHQSQKAHSIGSGQKTAGDQTLGDRAGIPAKISPPAVTSPSRQRYGCVREMNPLATACITTAARTRDTTNTQPVAVCRRRAYFSSCEFVDSNFQSPKLYEAHIFPAGRAPGTPSPRRCHAFLWYWCVRILVGKTIRPVPTPLVINLALGSFSLRKGRQGKSIKSGFLMFSVAFRFSKCRGRGLWVMTL